MILISTIYTSYWATNHKMSNSLPGQNMYQSGGLRTRPRILQSSSHQVGTTSTAQLQSPLNAPESRITVLQSNQMESAAQPEPVFLLDKEQFNQILILNQQNQKSMANSQKRKTATARRQKKGPYIPTVRIQPPPSLQLARPCSTPAITAPTFRIQPPPNLQLARTCSNPATSAISAPGDLNDVRRLPTLGITGSSMNATPAQTEVSSNPGMQGPLPRSLQVGLPSVNSAVVSLDSTHSSVVFEPRASVTNIPPAEAELPLQSPPGIQRHVPGSLTAAIPAVAPAAAGAAGINVAGPLAALGATAGPSANFTRILPEHPGGINNSFVPANIFPQPFLAPGIYDYNNGIYFECKLL